MAARTRQRRANGLGDLPETPMPTAPVPMLCTLVDRAFDSPDWIFEPKFDGLRILALFDGRQVTLLSRNNKPQEMRFPEIVDRVTVRRDLLTRDVARLGNDSSDGFESRRHRSAPAAAAGH